MLLSIYNNISMQNNIEYIIGGIEAFLCLMALIQTIRISLFSRNHPKKMLPKKVFHLIIVVAMLLKSSFFIIHPMLVSKKINLPFALIVGWFEAASFFMFLAFLALVLFWADFYDFLENGVVAPFFKRWCVRVVLGVIFWLLTLLMMSLVVLLILWHNDEIRLSDVQMIAEMVIAGMFLAAGLAYTVYGLRLASLLNQVRLAGSSAVKIALVASSITACFVARAILILYVLMHIQFHENSTIKFDTSPLIEFLYFFVTEILPTILMLFFLRKLPRWKESSVPAYTKVIQFTS
jgi:hypothetical protein